MVSTARDTSLYGDINLWEREEALYMALRMALRMEPRLTDMY